MAEGGGDRAGAGVVGDDHEGGGMGAAAAADRSGTSSSGGSGDSSNLCVDNSGCVVTKIANLYAERLMSDVILTVGNVDYPSHRLILCASSDVFQCMLMNPSWSESRETRVELRESTACANCFEDFLKYFYTGKIQLDFAKVIPLVSLADKYNVGDLLRLGLDFMSRNLATAAKRHQLVTWYGFAAADSGRVHLAESAAQFIRANFELISHTVDFGSLSFEHLLKLAQRSDIVVQDEMTFFQCVYRWLELQRQELERQGVMSESEMDLVVDHYVQEILPLIRFPMMTPAQLAHLLLNPLSVSHTGLLVERARVAVAYHQDKLEECYGGGGGMDAAFFTPRLYTAEPYCASISVDHFHNLQAYHCRSLVFSSQKFTQRFNESKASSSAHSSGASYSSSSSKYHQISSDEPPQLDWVVDVYPKGVWFPRGMTVYLPVGSGLELPEKVLRTVRVSVSTHFAGEVRVRIGLLAVGVQDGFEHIRQVRCRNYIFTENDQIVNFDDLVSYDDLNDLKTKSHFLSGPSRDSFKLLVVIVPLNKRSTLNL